MDPEIFKLPDCWEVGESKAIVPELSLSVTVRPLVAEPVNVKLLLPGVTEVPAIYSWPKGLVELPRSTPPATPGSNEVLIATDARLLRAWLAYDPLLRAKPQLAEFCKQIVPLASGRIICLSPPVETPVIWKRLVARVTEEPARYKSEKARVEVPRLKLPAVAGCNTELRATVPRLLRVLLA